MFIDSHCHIAGPVTGVDKAICVGTTLEDSQQAILLAQKYDYIFATVGIHPIDGIDSLQDWNQFEELIKQPKVVGIGECGLDYHHAYDPRQKPLFEKQLAIARKFNLPLSIHIRDAWGDVKTIDLSKNRGVFHCYSGPVEIPKNFYVSFAGNLTFRNAKNLQDLARQIPLEKMLLETDSPLLAPEPLRGSQNKPENVKIIASKLAELKSVSLDEVAAVTSKNAHELFHFPLH